MQPTNTEHLIVYIVNRLSGNVLKTALLKFLYLVDLEYVKKNYKQFTELKYIFYKNGPWDQKFDKILENLKDFEIKEVRQKKIFKDENYSLYYRGIKPRFKPVLPEEVIKIIDEKIYIFSKPKSQRSKVLKDILDYVYKDTKPMKYAIRNYPIDFSFEFMTPEDKKYVEDINREYMGSDMCLLVKDMSKEASKKSIGNLIKKKLLLMDEIVHEREIMNEESLLF
jgi:hypothetical protein